MKKAKPSITTERPDLKEMAEELNTFAAIEVLADSEGGQTLIKNLTDDIASAVDTLSMRYKDMPHVEMIALCASLRANLDMVRVLTRAKKNREYLSTTGL